MIPLKESASHFQRLHRDVGPHIIVLWRSNSAHFHRTWRVTSEYAIGAKHRRPCASSPTRFFGTWRRRSSARTQQQRQEQERDKDTVSVRRGNVRCWG